MEDILHTHPSRTALNPGSDQRKSASDYVYQMATVAAALLLLLTTTV